MDLHWGGSVVACSERLPAGVELAQPEDVGLDLDGVFLLVAVGTFVDIGGELVGAIVLVMVGVVLLVRALPHSD
ncbi:MAG: hypothetical protein OEM81_13980 [Acidimicrobiia bacterium]|nr:hypothetical protein [Acidimicrobiia bacterium]MDH3398921.1 hypothetical protein [Acidimicrobiia bacterium]